MTRAAPDQRGDTGYRADIDGLRALAVLSVALYHAEIPGFSGGYVGVDVFFVISGFLITRIIADGAARGVFSTLEFYERRVRRLLPALFLVAVAVSVFTLLFRSPRDADLFGESVTLFSVFAANIFFYNQLDYFADPVELYPLLHMWSLAVEEQFYLVYPPLFLLVWRWRADRVIHALGAVVALSFIASVVAVAHDPQLAFFHTPFRMWQLGLGGLVALAPPLIKRAVARDWAAFLGLALLLAPLGLYDDATPFPGLAAIPPTLGAALVIASGVGLGPGAAPGRAARLLAWRPLVFIGLCSYSFYLWHWPALSAARYLSFQPLSHVEAVGVLLIAFALSWATWAFVERPFRRPGGVLARGPLFGAALAGIAAFLLLGWTLQESKGLPGRFPELAPMFTEDARRYGPSVRECAPALDDLPPALRAEVDPAFCRGARAAPGRPVLLLWGDSHARALAPGLLAWAGAADVTIYLAWSPVCPPLVGADRSGVTRFHDCARQNSAAPKVAAALGAEQVLLAAQWSRYADRLNLTQHLAETSASLKAAGAQAIVLAEVPPQLGHVPTLVFRAARIGADYPLARDLATLSEPIRSADAALREAAAPVGVRVLSPASALCPDGLCAVSGPDGAPLYADSHHLNRIGARLIGGALGAEIAKRP